MIKTRILLGGAARRTINPRRGIFLIVYGDRTKGNHGVHDDLTASAVVLDDGTKRIVVVALDMLAINEFIVDKIRGRLAPTEALLCCSHTHSGPIAYAGEGSRRKNLRYINSLVEAIIEAVHEADDHLVPVRLEYARGEADIAINRREKSQNGTMNIGRNPAGAVDRSLQVISILDEQGGRLATLVNYACHGTVLGSDNLLASADWIGVMRAGVETKLGGMALFLQGATADLNPDMYWGDGRVYEMVEKQGMRVANAVVEAVAKGSKQIRTVPLRLERSELWLPTETRVTS